MAYRARIVIELPQEWENLGMAQEWADSWLDHFKVDSLVKKHGGKVSAQARYQTTPDDVERILKALDLETDQQESS